MFDSMVSVLETRMLWALALSAVTPDAGTTTDESTEPATAEVDAAAPEAAPVVVEGPVSAWAADPMGMDPVAAIDALVAIQAQRARLDAAEAAFLVRAAGATAGAGGSGRAGRPRDGAAPRPNDCPDHLTPC